MQILEPSMNSRTLGIMYAGRTADGNADDAVLLAVNVYWEEQEMKLPEGTAWHVLMDTELPDGFPDGEKREQKVRDSLRLSPRSARVLLLCGE